jgi:hypothetical protein
VAVDRFVTEIVMGAGEVVSGARPAPLLAVLQSSAPPVEAPRLPEAA